MIAGQRAHVPPGLPQATDRLETSSGTKSLNPVALPERSIATSLNQNPLI
jgi:hypothetical protein